ncbi:hypothetical protein HMPREF9711_01661 [Myroides odoratimimus CCUG 3837]|uniref:hypothetical protein n=1 Tax=Myroides odoratimimus TaxID=76832 RepID=UPI000280A637|nr:hypothetical protein [Myroides odoratimimus]EKB04796.1 hypothetical protein HMPREF9711_01661 [Myroides odoratimimus CCUG 3837]
MGNKVIPTQQEVFNNPLGVADQQTSQVIVDNANFREVTAQSEGVYREELFAKKEGTGVAVKSSLVKEENGEFVQTLDGAAIQGTDELADKSFQLDNGVVFKKPLERTLAGLNLSDDTKLPLDGSKQMEGTLKFAEGNSQRPAMILPKGDLTSVAVDGAIERDAEGEFYLTKDNTRSRILSIREVNSLPTEVPAGFEMVYLKSDKSFYVADGHTWSVLVKSSIPKQGGNESMVIKDIRQVTADEYAALPKEEKGPHTLYITKGSPFNVITIPPPVNPPVINIDDIDLTNKKEILFHEFFANKDNTYSSDRLFNFSYHQGTQEIIVRVYDYDPTTDKEEFVAEYLGKGINNWWLGSKAGVKRIKYLIAPESVSSMRKMSSVTQNVFSELKNLNRVEGISIAQDFLDISNLKYLTHLGNTYLERIDVVTIYKVLDISVKLNEVIQVINLQGETVSTLPVATIDFDFSSVKDLLYFNIEGFKSVKSPYLIEKFVKNLAEAGRFNGTFVIPKTTISKECQQYVQTLQKRGWSVKGIEYDA